MINKLLKYESINITLEGKTFKMVKDRFNDCLIKYEDKVIAKMSLEEAINFVKNL